MKRCTKCGLEQPLNNFTHDHSSKDGYSYWCRACRKASRRYGDALIKAREEQRIADIEKAKLAAEGLRRCTKCNQIKPYQEYNRERACKDGYQYICIRCALDYSRERTRKRKQQVVDHYGGHCICCGEDKLEFLAIHHFSEDGGKHRGTLGSRRNAIVDWLIKKDFPDGFQIYCHNCHAALHFYGYCPHNKTNV